MRRTQRLDDTHPKPSLSGLRFQILLDFIALSLVQVFLHIICIRICIRKLGFCRLLYSLRFSAALAYYPGSTYQQDGLQTDLECK